MKQKIISNLFRFVRRWFCRKKAPTIEQKINVPDGDKIDILIKIRKH